MKNAVAASWRRNGGTHLSVSQARIEQLAAVRGWIEPVFTRTDPVTGKQHRLITQADGAKIAAGYACGECGAVYDMVMPGCAVCGEPIGLQLAPMRDEWTDHLADRAAGGVEGRPVSTDEFLAEIAADRDIDHRKL